MSGAGDPGIINRRATLLVLGAPEPRANGHPLESFEYTAASS